MHCCCKNKVLKNWSWSWQDLWRKCVVFIKIFMFCYICSRVIYKRNPIFKINNCFFFKLIYIFYNSIKLHVCLFLFYFKLNFCFSIITCLFFGVFNCCFNVVFSKNFGSKIVLYSCVQKKVLDQWWIFAGEKILKNVNYVKKNEK